MCEYKFIYVYVQIYIDTECVYVYIISSQQRKGKEYDGTDEQLIMEMNLAMTPTQHSLLSFT